MRVVAIFQMAVLAKGVWRRSATTERQIIRISAVMMRVFRTSAGGARARRPRKISGYLSMGLVRTESPLNDSSGYFRLARSVL